MTNFEQYLCFNEEKDKEEQLALLQKINISADQTAKIKGISVKKNLLIFAEPFCPDCRILVAVVERIRKLNQLSINIEYLSRKDNAIKLEMMTENSKIPSVFLLDGLKVTKIMEEYPSGLEITDETKKEYRKGKYVDLIIETILSKIC